MRISYSVYNITSVYCFSEKNHFLKQYFFNKYFKRFVCGIASLITGLEK